MDILAALNSAPSRGQQKCKVQRFLDSIPDDEPGREQLVQAVATSELAAGRLSVVFSQLGHPIGLEVIREHRAQQCACFR